jgi:hypothetical protein
MLGCWKKRRESENKFCSRLTGPRPRPATSIWWRNSAMEDSKEEGLCQISFVFLVITWLFSMYISFFNSFTCKVIIYVNLQPLNMWFNAEFHRNTVVFCNLISMQYKHKIKSVVFVSLCPTVFCRYMSGLSCWRHEGEAIVSPMHLYWKHQIYSPRLVRLFCILFTIFWHRRGRRGFD